MKANSLSISVFLSLFLPLIVLGQSSFYMQGYVKEMPSVSFSGDFDRVFVDNLLHNRLNFRWQVSQEWRAVFEMRNRILVVTPPRVILFLAR